jgi:hypothetical protein
MDFAAFSIWKPVYVSEKLHFKWPDDLPVLETEPIRVADTRTNNDLIAPCQSTAAK